MIASLWWLVLRVNDIAIYTGTGQNWVLWPLISTTQIISWTNNPSRMVPWIHLANKFDFWSLPAVSRHLDIQDPQHNPTKLCKRVGNIDYDIFRKLLNLWTWVTEWLKWVYGLFVIQMWMIRCKTLLMNRHYFINSETHLSALLLTWDTLGTTTEST